MEKISVIHEPTKQKPFLIINKPKGLPSAPLAKDDFENAFCQAAKLFPQLLEVHGKKEIEHGLLHRLDTSTNGLIVIAATQQCYDFLIAGQENGRFIKTYSAECDIINDNAKRLGGFPPDLPECKALGFEETELVVSSYFRPFGEGRKQVRPVTEKSGKAALLKLGKSKVYTTKITIKKVSETNAVAKCTIAQGFRHQVRCHLAWAGFPVCEDGLYNSNFNSKSDFVKNNAQELLKFSATEVSLEFTKGFTKTFCI